MKQNSVKIYRDEGVSAPSYRQLYASLKEYGLTKENIQRITAEELNVSSACLDNVDLVIFPGGRDLPYHNKLKGKGTKHLRRYVEEGGAYLGICAGAYFGASQVLFAEGTPLEVQGERELSFAPVLAVGPSLTSFPFEYNSECGADAAEILCEDGKELSVYFNGGCHFQSIKPNPDYDVIARYKHNAQACILSRKVGKGQIVLSGVHLEYQSTLLHRKDPNLARIAPSLEKSEKARKTLFKQCLRAIFRIKSVT